MPALSEVIVFEIQVDTVRCKLTVQCNGAVQSCNDEETVRLPLSSPRICMDPTRKKTVNYK